MKNNSQTLRPMSKRKMIKQGLNVVAGIDLGDKHSQVCLLNLDGEIVERKKLRTSPTAFERYFGEWAPPEWCWKPAATPTGCTACSSDSSTSR